MTDRIRAQLRDVQSRERELGNNIRDHEQRISRLQSERSRASAHWDALLRQQDIDRQIADLQRGKQALERELSRTRNEIRGLESALR